MSGLGETSLNNYAQHLLNAMEFLRIYRSEKEVSFLQKIFTLIMAITLLSGNLILIISELANLKDVKDVRELATSIGPIFLHVTGIMKWFSCMLNIKKITSLIDLLKHCHHLTSKTCQNSKGMSLIPKVFSSSNTN